MQRLRKQITSISTTNRSCVTNGTRLLTGIDGRGAIARRFRDILRGPPRETWICRTWIGCDGYTVLPLQTKLRPIEPWIDGKLEYRRVSEFSEWPTQKSRNNRRKGDHDARLARSSASTYSNRVLGLELFVQSEQSKSRNRPIRRIPASSEHGNPLRPTSQKTNKVELTPIPRADTNEDPRIDHKPISVSSLEIHGDHIVGLISIPKDALAPILSMMVGDRFKFVTMGGTKFWHRKSRLHSPQLEMNFGRGKSASGRRRIVVAQSTAEGHATANSSCQPQMRN